MALLTQRNQKPDLRLECNWPRCGTRVARKQDLVRHCDERHKEKKKCVHCPYETRRTSRLVAHTSKKHSFLSQVQTPDADTTNHKEHQIAPPEHPSGGSLASRHHSGQLRQRREVVQHKRRLFEDEAAAFSESQLHHTLGSTTNTALQRNANISGLPPRSFANAQNDHDLSAAISAPSSSCYDKFTGLASNGTLPDLSLNYWIPARSSVEPRNSQRSDANTSPNLQQASPYLAPAFPPFYESANNNQKSMSRRNNDMLVPSTLVHQAPDYTGFVAQRGFPPSTSPPWIGKSPQHSSYVARRGFEAVGISSNMTSDGGYGPAPPALTMMQSARTRHMSPQIHCNNVPPLYEDDLGFSLAELDFASFN